ncbi:MAG: type II toxin-antitoxin system VapC family toxin [Patescibacteria group bacterium]
MQYLLDTNAVIYYVGGEPRALGTMRPLMLTDDHTFILPSIVVTELWSGKQALVETRIIEEFMETLLMFPLDVPLAKSAGELRRNYNLSIGDAIVAATAIAFDAIILTRNVRDFKRVPGLSVQQV